jgi:hypothetical protein
VGRLLSRTAAKSFRSSTQLVSVDREDLRHMVISFHLRYEAGQGCSADREFDVWSLAVAQSG